MTGRNASSDNDVAAGPHPRATLSSEPIVNFAFRWLLDIAFLCFVLAIVYMSFVPFDLTLSPPDKGWRAGRVVLGLTVSSFNLPDILANIVYYVPISTLGFFVLRRRMGWFTTCFALLTLGAALSFGVEFTQQWTVSRVPAWADVAANVIGLVVGLGLAIILHPFVRLFARRARDSLRMDPAGAAAKMLVCFLLLIHVRPFDLATDIPRTVLNAARHGDFRFTARWENVTNSRIVPAQARADRARYEYLMDQFAATAGYAALASLLMLSGRREAGSGIGAIAWCGFVTISLAAIVTGLRVLMVSHGLDTAHLLCGVIGWILGVLMSVPLVPARRDPSVRTREGAGQWSALAALIVCGWIIAYELIPFDFVGAGLAHARATGRIFLLPMSGHVAGSVPNLVADVTGKLLRYAAFSLCISTLIAASVRTNWRRNCIMVTTLTAAAVAAMQLVHLFQPSRTCDSTNILIAATAAFITSVLFRGVQDFRPAGPRVVDDLLTGQLIEGATYDKDALKSLRRPRSDASPTAAAPTAPRD